MPESSPVVFLVDIDNTLIDGDQVVVDVKNDLCRAFGALGLAQYWTIFEGLRAELGYVDYLGALQRYRHANLTDQRCLEISNFLLNYPFHERLLPGALDVLAKLKAWGPTVILTDGDVVFQPWKARQSGIFDAVDGNVLIYIHKELVLDDVAQHYPAEHYVLIDDKVRILSAVKKVWGSRLTTVFPRFGHYALDAEEVAKYPTPDITVEHIADVLGFDLPTLIAAGQRSGV